MASLFGRGFDSLQLHKLHKKALNIADIQRFFYFHSCVVMTRLHESNLVAVRTHAESYQDPITSRTSQYPK